jgi:carbonic anhydrase/acetyltransferase-like protein (isoleucine patch superfamily)
MIRSFNGKTPRIAESAFVSEAAYVVGDVEIGENSSVWPGTVIRGDSGTIRIGKNTNIQDNSVVHGGTTIGDNVHVGHGAIINCRRIGNNVLIGMNATLLHEAEIGNLCIIAAACLVSQGMKVPDRSFVAGVPAEIRGEASPQQLSRWAEAGPQGYAELARQYKEQGL